MVGWQRTRAPGKGPGVAWKADAGRNTVGNNTTHLSRHFSCSLRFTYMAFPSALIIHIRVFILRRNKPPRSAFVGPASTPPHPRIGKVFTTPNDYHDRIYHNTQSSFSSVVEREIADLQVACSNQAGSFIFVGVGDDEVLPKWRGERKVALIPSLPSGASAFISGMPVG